MKSDDVSMVEELLKRIQGLEGRVNTLETLSNNAPSPCAETAENPGTEGTVSYRGKVTLGEATYAYEWERPTSHLTGRSWDQAMKQLGATAHPVRGRILQHLLHQPATVSELVDADIVSSTGTGYHHLAALQSAGWIQKDSHGQHSIKPTRVVALLAIILAMEEA